MGEPAIHDLQDELERRDDLYRELTHRVANNFQTVVALLNGAVAAVSDHDTKQTILGLSARVRSMALVHNRLYAGDASATQDVGHYLSGLCADLRNGIFVGDRPPEMISCDIQQGIMCSADKAVIMGLTVAELVMNAVKHAFPNGGGHVIVSLKRVGPNVHLTVADDGVGFPVNCVPGMGTRIIKSQVRLLGGTAGYKDVPAGTQFDIEFACPG